MIGKSPIKLKTNYLQIHSETRIFVKNTRIMTTKLTLTVEKAVIEQAKSYAKNTGRSLSEIIENYLTTITTDKVENNLSPKLKKLVGAVNLPEDFDDKAALRLVLEEKHF